MGQQYPSYTIWVENIVAILHIYGARSISLLFCDYQDTESESCEMEFGVSGPMFAHKNTKGFMVQQYRYPTIWENKFTSILHFWS